MKPAPSITVGTTLLIRKRCIRNFMAGGLLKGDDLAGDMQPARKEETVLVELTRF